MYREGLGERGLDAAGAAWIGRGVNWGWLRHGSEVRAKAAKSVLPGLNRLRKNSDGWRKGEI